MKTQGGLTGKTSVGVVNKLVTQKKGKEGATEIKGATEPLVTSDLLAVVLFNAKLGTR